VLTGQPWQGSCPNKYACSTHLQVLLCGHPISCHLCCLMSCEPGRQRINLATQLSLKLWAMNVHTQRFAQLELVLFTHSNIPALSISQRRVYASSASTWPSSSACKFEEGVSNERRGSAHLTRIAQLGFLHALNAMPGPTAAMTRERLSLLSSSGVRNEACGQHTQQKT
jgi:hypothetical protein